MDLLYRPLLAKGVQKLLAKKAPRVTNYVYDASLTLTSGKIPGRELIVAPLRDRFRNVVRGDFLELYTVTGDSKLILGIPNDQIYIKGMRTDRGVKAMPDYLSTAMAQYERISKDLNVVGILNGPVADGYYVVRRVPNNINYSMWAKVQSLDELHKDVRGVLL